MNRQHSATPAGQRLAAQNVITHVYAQLTFSTNMLLQRNDKTRRQRNLSQRSTI